MEPIPFPFPDYEEAPASPSAPVDEPRAARGPRTWPGVYPDLARMDRRDLLDDVALGRALGVCAKTVMRHVARGRLPRPVTGRLWLAGQVLDHFEAEAARLAREAEAIAARRRRGVRRPR